MRMDALTHHGEKFDVALVRIKNLYVEGFGGRVGVQRQISRIGGWFFDTCWVVIGCKCGTLNHEWAASVGNSSKALVGNLRTPGK